MKIELLILLIFGFLIANTYYDNKLLDGEEFRPIKVSHDGEVISTCKVKIRKDKE